MRLIIECKGERREFPLPEGTTVVGRDPGCDICVAEGSLSRRHLELERSGERITVRDLETKNGTFVGQQRIHEARLQAGMRLRAGNLWMRFEKEEAGSARPLETGSASLECRIPDAPGFQPDDAPTPADEAVSQAFGGEGAGTEMIVRDGRWYVRDVTTGVEVEVVPSSAPSSEAGPVVLPAVVTRRKELPGMEVRTAAPAGVPRRGRALKISLFALLTAVAALVLLFLFQPKKPAIEYLSLPAYRERVTAAVEKYKEGHAQDAAELLEQVRSMPMETRMELPGMLLAAFKADIAANDDFEQNFEEATQCWDDVQRSAEANGVPNAKQLADSRLTWLSGETLNMANMTEARQAMGKREFLRALAFASQVKEGSRFRKDAPAIIEEAVAQLKKAVADQAATQDWTGAIASMQELMRVYPPVAEEFGPKIAQYRAYEDQRQKLEAARAEAEAGTSGRAIAALSAFPPDSPYAREAAALLALIHDKTLLQQATATYNAGDGPAALAILAQLPAADPKLVQRIKTVVAAKAAADEALKRTEYSAALEKLNEILRYERPENNRYAAEAQGRKDAMEKMKGETARNLVKSADEAAQARDFRAARRKYLEAQNLDPANRGAKDGLTKLEEWAIRDYNLALNMVKEDPQTALQLFQEVADRLPPDHALAVKVQIDILNVKLQIGKNPVKETDRPAEENQP